MRGLFYLVTAPEKMKLLMKIAIIGYGKMGREIETAAKKRGHEIVIKIDMDNIADLKSGKFKSADVALEFTTPDTAARNIVSCFDAGVPVVCGTTGWTDGLDEIKQLCIKEDQTFFYSSNFSLGVNVMFKLNLWLANVMNRFPDFNVSLSEVHHVHKKDAPSGTAVTLAEGILQKIERKRAWKNEDIADPDILPVTSERRGEVPGTHIIKYNSEYEILEISHQALSRSVFASGVVLAAEFLAGKKGIFDMDDLLDI